MKSLGLWCEISHLNSVHVFLFMAYTPDVCSLVRTCEKCEARSKITSLYPYSVCCHYVTLNCNHKGLSKS